MRSAFIDLGSQPITNLGVDPRATKYNPGGPGFYNDRWSGVSAYTLISGATDGPPGTGLSTYVRMTCTGSHNGLGFDLGSNPEAAGAIPTNNWTKVQPGTTYTLSVWVRCSQSLVCEVRQRYSDGANWQSTDAVGTQTPAANTWVRLSVTAVAPSGAAAMASYITVPSTLNVGDTIDATGLMIHAGSLTPVYCDGSAPGWKWFGTAGASQSAGYPYTLASIAGAPLAVNTTQGSVTAIAANDPTPLSGLSLYVAYQALDNSAGTGATSATPMATAGGTGATATAVSAVGTVEIRTQIDTTGTTSYWRAAQQDGVNVVAYDATTRTLGGHVDSMTITLAGTYTFRSDGAVWYTTTGTWSSGVSLLNLALGAATTRSSPVCAVLYRGPHNDATANRITGWLARQYGAPIPVGY